MRDNRLGIQTEWWYHLASGTGFLAERDTRSDEILRTFLPTADDLGPAS